MAVVIIPDGVHPEKECAAQSTGHWRLGSPPIPPTNKLLVQVGAGVNVVVIGPTLVKVHPPWTETLRMVRGRGLTMSKGMYSEPSQNRHIMFTSIRESPGPWTLKGSHPRLGHSNAPSKNLDLPIPSNRKSERTPERAWQGLFTGF